MEEKTLRSAHGRTNSRERWSCPRFPDAPPLTARLDSLTASSRSHPSQSLHMTERSFTHGGWIIACAASQLWIAGIAPSFVRRTLVFHRHSRFRSSKLRRCGMRGRSTEGREGSEIRVRGRDRGIVRVMWECCSSCTLVHFRIFFLPGSGTWIGN